MNEQKIELSISELRSSSRISILFAVLGGILILSSLFYSFTRLTPLEAKVSEKISEIKELKDSKNKLEIELNELKDEVKETKQTQDSILKFLKSVSDKNKIHILDSDVNWNDVTGQLESLKAGDRKNALFNSILMAWKDIPFGLNEESTLGFDSPRFLNFILGSVGIQTQKKSNQRMSDALMSKFEKVESPKPGDLVFFKGRVGNFGFIILATGESDEGHIGVGTLERANPLQIIKMKNINTLYFPLKGYYRVVYPDEMPNKSLQPTAKAAAE